MKRLCLLHITDLHFSQDGNASSAINCKNKKSISSRLIKSITSDCRARFVEDASMILKRCNIELDGIVCTGDVGTGSHRVLTLPSGIDYIERLANKFNVPHGNVILVPGNHDLDRNTPGHELDLFIKKCKEKKFSYTKSITPKKIIIKSIPVYALNSCVGGTEQAFHGIAKEKWGDVLKKYDTESFSSIIKSFPELTYQFEEMDIPVLGLPQLDDFSKSLMDDKGHFALVLMHHNPLPTNNIELRPFANLVDSGIFIQKLVASNKDIIVLHGHAHCESALKIYQYGNGNSPNKLIAALGHHGLSNGGKSLAAVIDLFFNDAGLFIKANVIHIELNGSCYVQGRSFSLKSNNCRVDLDIDWKHIEKLKKYSFPDFASKITRQPDERLAETLLMSNPEYIDITNIDAKYEDWQICRNI